MSFELRPNVTKFLFLFGKGIAAKGKRSQNKEHLVQCTVYLLSDDSKEHFHVNRKQEGQRILREFRENEKCRLHTRLPNACSVKLLPLNCYSRKRFF